MQLRLTAWLLFDDSNANTNQTDEDDMSSNTPDDNEVIHLDPSKTDHQQIINKHHHLDGLRKTIKDLSTEVGIVYADLWRLIREEFPETKEGSWKTRYDGQQFRLEKTSSD